MMEILNIEVPFNNTIVSDIELIASLNLSNLDENQLKALCSKNIKGIFEVPNELKKHIEANSSKVFISYLDIYESHFILDLECNMDFEILSDKSQAIDSIVKYQEKNGDLRWKLSILWKAEDGNDYLFDGWDDLSITEAIEDYEEWYE